MKTIIVNTVLEVHPASGAPSYQVEAEIETGRGEIIELLTGAREDQVSEFLCGFFLHGQGKPDFISALRKAGLTRNPERPYIDALAFSVPEFTE